ncbi:MAG: phosphate/phosphite/phosphonate ABC transporter substrate-binding protein [Thiotrichaceae bacterium]
MLIKRLYGLLGCIALSLFSHVQAADKNPESLTLGFMPYLTASQLTSKYTPLADYLSEKLKIPVTLQIAKNYDEHIKNVGEDKIDIAFLGGSPYIKIVEKYGKKPLLVRYEIHGKPTFHGVIVVSQSSKLKDLKELIGKKVAFGDASSTLSAQVPRYMLAQAGVPLDKLSGHEFLNNHENVVYGVILGDYAAGALAEEVFIEYQKKGIRALATSPAISTHVFVANSQLPGALVDQIRQVLLDLKQDPQGQEVLAKMGREMTGFSPVKDEDYDTLREILKSLSAVTP